MFSHMTCHTKVPYLAYKRKLHCVATMSEFDMFQFEISCPHGVGSVSGSCQLIFLEPKKTQLGPAKENSSIREELKRKERTNK